MSARTSCRRARAAGRSRDAAARGVAHDHRRERRGQRALGSGRRGCAPREDRPGQPVYAIAEPSSARRDGAAPRRRSTTSSPYPGLRSGQRVRAGGQPAGARPGRVPLVDPRRRWPTAGPGSGRRTGWIVFKAEASAWTPAAVQIPAGLGRPRDAGVTGYAHARAAAISCRLLLATTPTVDALRPEPRTRRRSPLYESIGMQSSARVPEHPLLTLGRLLRMARSRAGCVRWAAGELAAYAGPPSARPGPPPLESPRTRPAGCPAPNEGSGRDRTGPIAAVRCFVWGSLRLCS